MPKNVVFVTLSTLSKDPKKNYYAYDDLFCSGIHQQEPAIKHFLSVAKIDKIVFLGSEQTTNESDTELSASLLRQWTGKLCQDNFATISSFRLLVYRLADFVYGKEKDGLAEPEKGALSEEEYSSKRKMSSLSKDNIRLVFIKDNNDASQNAGSFKELIDKIKSESGDNVNLYMDIQGGSRTSIYVNNAILQLVGKQKNVYHIELAEIVATQYTTGKPYHKIANENDRLSVIELVSGMNAFLNYGKAAPLVKYLEGLKKGKWFDDKVNALVQAMNDIDVSISQCRIYSDDDSKSGQYLSDAIGRLKLALNDLKQLEQQDNQLASIFNLLSDGISSDYGGLLKSKDVDILALIKWRIAKKDIFSAASLVEALLPDYLVKNSIIYYAATTEELQLVKDYFYLYCLADYKRKFIYSDISHYFIKTYLQDIGFYLLDKKQLVDYRKGSSKLSWAINSQNNYPVRLHSSCHGELLYNILSKYQYISDNRNLLAHPGEGTAISLDDFEAVIVGLCDDVDKCLKKPNALYLAKNVINFNNTKPEYIYKILQRAVSNETVSAQYGITDEIINGKLPKNPKYVLHHLIGELNKVYDHICDFKNPDSCLQFVSSKQNKALSELLIDYYNRNNGQELAYSDVVKMASVKAGNSTPESAVEYIKKGLHSYADFKKLSAHLDSEESWDGYIRELMAMLDSGKATAEDDIESNKKLIRDIVRPLYGSDGWKDMVNYYASDIQLTAVLIETIGSPYKDYFKNI